MTAILLLALALGVVGIFPGAFYPDEGHVQTYSWGIVKNAIAFGDFNPHTFKYGSLVFYLQALAALPVLLALYLVKGGDFTAFFDEAIVKYNNLLVVSGRLQTVLLGVASVFLVYLIAKRLFNERVGYLASLILATSPMWVKESHYMLTDTLFVFSLLLAFYLSIRLIEERTCKWFFWVGFISGLSATIRFFPLVFLIYPFAIFPALWKQKHWLPKLIANFAAIWLGVFVGLPFLFLDPQGLSLLAADLARYALPWYGTALTKLIFSGAKFDFLYPAPTGFRPLQASWIFFNGLGPVPSILGLAGMLLLLFKSFRKFLLLAAIPIGLFIYISFFIPAIYEKLSLPILPFGAVFAGLAVEQIHRKGSWFVWTTVILLSILPDLVKSAKSSSACSQDQVQKQSRLWIETNVPDNATVAHLPMVSAPSDKRFSAWSQLEPNNDLSLEETKNLGVSYVFLNASRLDYENYHFFNDFFVVPDVLFVNSYQYLVLAEYFSRARLLTAIEKPMMCDKTRIYFFELPTEEKSYTTKPIDVSGSSLWQVDDYGFEKARLEIGNGIFTFYQSPVKYTPPRIKSATIPVEPDAFYIFSFWARAVDKGAGQRIIARLDFEKEKPSFSEEVIGRFGELKLLGEYGSTQRFFEEKMERVTKPQVALSSRLKLEKRWQKISVTAKAPREAKFLTLSIQDTNFGEASFEIGRLELSRAID